MNKRKNTAFQRTFKVFRLIAHISPSYLIWTAVYALFTSLFPYIAIYFSAKIIDSLVANNAASITMGYVYWLITLDLAVGIINAFLGKYLEAAGEKTQNLMKKKIASKGYELAYSQAENEETMRMVAAANEGSNGSGGISSFADSFQQIIKSLSDFVYSLLLLSGLFIIGTPTIQDALTPFLTNPASSLIVFAPVFLAVLVAIPLASLSNRLSYRAMKENVEGNRRYGYFYDLCSNYRYGKEIRLYAMQDMIMAEQVKSKNDVNKTWDNFSKIDSGLSIIITFAMMIVSFVSYAFMGLKALYGLISVGNAVAYVGAITLFAGAISKFISGIILLNLNANYLQNYFDYLEIPTALRYGKEKLNEKEPLEIEFRHVVFTYPGDTKKALDGVSLHIHPGEKLAIVGLNGAGKTTLMKLICRFYEPDSGEILVNHKPLDSYDAESSYRLYAIVFQDFKLFSFSILDNVASGPNGNREKAIACLKKVGIYDRVLAFPDGLDTIIYNENDKNGVEVSGGEAQKIAIARALYKDSPLVILDEPTAALDPKSEAEVYEDLGELTKGKTAVFISHRMSSTQFCDKIAVIADGKLIEEGTHRELMANQSGLYRRMWEAQAQYYRD